MRIFKERNNVGDDSRERYFIINKMYAGSYLAENDFQNIGHEVVNLFSDDNGDNYIYINPTGIIPSKYDDKIEYVILTKQYSKGCQEVLGIAKVGEQLIKKSENKEDIPRQAKKYKNQIKYGKQTLAKIFKNNTYNGGEDSYSENPVITFKTKEFYLPSKRILIAEKDSPIQEDGATIYELPDDYKFGHQSLRFYFSNKDEKTKKAFKTLEELINNKTLFKESMPSKISQADIDRYGKEVTSYLEIMGKINNENIYSNLLRYFLKTDRSLLASFCKGVCDVDDIQKNKAKIEREKHRRTDIWIEDDNNVIVIENKIDAGLSEPKQLENYREKANEEANGRKVTLRLIAPNHYGKIKLDANGECDGFKMIRYSEIHEVLKDYQTIKIKGEDKEYIDKVNLYYSDFLRALSIHGQSEKTADQESAERLLFKKIYLLSKNDKL